MVGGVVGVGGGYRYPIYGDIYLCANSIRTPYTKNGRLADGFPPILVGRIRISDVVWVVLA